MSERTFVELRYVGGTPLPHFHFQWAVFYQGRAEWLIGGYTKAATLKEAIAWCRDPMNQPCELTIKNKDGSIGRGGSARRTYPRSSDPPETKG
mgnify:CR=1 FL=1